MMLSCVTQLSCFHSLFAVSDDTETAKMFENIPLNAKRRR